VVRSSMISGTWSLVACSPLDSIFAWRRLFLWQIGVLFLLVGIVMYFFASIFARFNSVRIVRLTDITQKVKKGDLSVRCSVDSDDEIGNLQLNFNEMIHQMESMLKTQYELGRQVQNSELKLLQAQINPHFLYNTLNLISWTAKNKEPDEVCDIVNKLSQFYRIGLSNGFELISLQDELAHVSLYVQLQNKSHEVHLEVHVEQNVLDILILKLLLQPIVENSIVHGLAETGGTITIDISQTLEFLSIVIADNGSGISPEKQSLIRLKQELQATSIQQGGFGIANVTKRLRNYYGDVSKLEFTSIPGKGTSTEILIPISKCIQR